jgi:hypothetical protein
MENIKTFETGCCPQFDPSKYDEKEVQFDNKLFLKDHVTSLFHIPLNFGKVMTRSMSIIENSDAEAVEQLVLTDENSLWGSDVYIHVDKEIPDATMERISGNFLTKVFEGPYKDIGKFVKEMKSYFKSKSKDLKKLYLYYLYCPKCSKEYGRNYIVLFGKYK